MNKRFYNKDPGKNPQNFINFIKWKLTSKKPQWPKHVELQSKDKPPSNISDNVFRISFVGHVTFLIQTQSLNILTDPVWSERASPLSNIGAKRVTEPGIAFDDLPKIDIVLISHNHYDHMDISTLKKIWYRDKPKIIVPLKNEATLLSHIPGISVDSLNWHEFVSVNQDISIYLEPAQHWSRRGVFDLNKALWGTFIIKTPYGSICFIGDSGYDPHIYKEIGNKFDIHVSLIPIGCFEPRWFMKNVHMNPEEAVLVHQDLKSNFSMASHFETFQLADDGFHEAALELAKAKEKYQISGDTFITPSIGSYYWF